MSSDQRRLNLSRANRIRTERRFIKERLATRSILLDDLLEAPPECVRNATVVEVIQWAPFFGSVKASAAMRRLGEPEHRLLGHMTKLRRRELVKVLGRHHPKALWGAAHREYVC